jgi:excisionase family DNA binding protein
VIAAEGELAAARLLAVQEAAEQLRISRWSVYNLIRANQLRTIKIGRRRLFRRMSGSTRLHHGPPDQAR